MNLKRQLTNILALAIALLSLDAYSQINLNYATNETPEWDEVISMYEYLSSRHKNARLIEAGMSDVGKPLHLFIISKDGIFTPEEVHASGKRILFINNGIHPGESNGIDASIEFASNLLSGNDKNAKYLENTVVLIVPVFNIGGALNRSPYHRANQNGPLEQGFRGNARNLDLNRDFVKMDSRNSWAMVKLIQEWDPDIFLDTHSTNGADYPYTVTLISSHHQQLEAPQSTYLKDTLEPWIYKTMNRTAFKTCPYVNSYMRSPERGLEGFYEYPRYLAGYTSTFHILSFTVETHMLKPYEERVASTLTLFQNFLKFTSKNAKDIAQAKSSAIELSREKKNFVLQWSNDTSRYDMISFQGYKAKTKISPLTGQTQLYYDQHDTWEDMIPYYNYFKAETEVKAPEFYIIPQAWSEVIERLKANNIAMDRFPSDTSMHVESYFIEDFKTTDAPYNGHYWHHSVKVNKKTVLVDIYAGDYLVPVAQRGSEYLVHTLEPQAYDSYFSWNFFDATLSRKEYFSPYLFEDEASGIIASNDSLARAFKNLKSSDSEFAANAYAQLRWIYERSPYSEKTYRRYPIYRLNP